MSRKKNSFNTGPQHVLARLAEVAEVCDDLADQLDNLGVAVDDIKQTLGDLAQAKPELNAVLQPLSVKGRKQALPAATQARYASDATLSWQGEKASVLIDGKALYLPRLLGILMEVLLSEEPDPYGTPIRDGWHSRLDLASRVSDRVGRVVSRHALENLISRLKRQLRLQAGLAEIVQTSSNLGVRIALKKHLIPRPGEPSGNLPPPP